jgi:hypothetical protein
MIVFRAVTKARDSFLVSGVSIAALYYKGKRQRARKEAIRRKEERGKRKEA